MNDVYPAISFSEQHYLHVYFNIVHLYFEYSVSLDILLHFLSGTITLIMDGDQSAKTMEDGANKAMQGNDLTGGIHETVNQNVLGQSTVLPAFVDLRTGRCRGENDRDWQQHVLERWSHRFNVQWYVRPFPLLDIVFLMSSA